MPSIKTIHKTYNRKSENYVYKGNAVTDGQYSGYVRPFKQVECNENYFKLGELQDFDLQPFIDRHVPNNVLAAARQAANENGGCCLYMFRHFPRKDYMIVHGYVITKREDAGSTLLRVFHTNRRPQSVNIVTVCADALSRSS